jgi:hypothetical protein
MKLASVAAVLAGALAVAQPTSAFAAFTTFSDSTAFNSAISTSAASGTDTFDELTNNIGLGHTLDRSAGMPILGLSYQAFDPVGANGLKAGFDADGFLTNQFRTSTITLRSFGSGINAFGANFFGSELTSGFPILGERIHVFVEESDGDLFDFILTNTSRSTFLGFIGDSPLTQVQFWTCEFNTAEECASTNWPSIDNLTLARDAIVPVPEPMSLPLVGLALMGVAAASCRRRKQ